jgi:hypothetical protein
MRKATGLEELELVPHVDVCIDQPIKDAGYEPWRTVTSPPWAGKIKYVCDRMR